MCALALVASLESVAAVAAQGAPDEASLRLAHATIVKAVTSGNLAVIQGLIHPQASGFFRESQQPVQLGPGVTPADILPALVGDLARFVSTQTNTGVRVIGSVGIVNMTLFQQRKRNERGSDRYVRGTYVYIADGDNWKLAAWHGSDTPLQK
jgi:SnoaL-like domain